ncbi:F-box domain, Leucine-rich repeat domain, L domain-like protein [Artemisia annua]|uniref:F-box domain, Leucine-rich repeat domain, L domain-like protein n=1 Tax=Artemisia annua TaxID=35608 RepID=A0A2U1MZE2_ARTAN|nr:F-box domain, Leucine-rich repeat domain, L domain-like protein [Artemisia annua]
MAKNKMNPDILIWEIMGSENDKKRLDVEVDRLSSLPDDLIHKILSFNDTIDAINTSTLSSRWRCIWTTMTCLDFSSEDFPNLPKFSKFVKHVLSGRDNQREVSSVKLSFHGKASQVFVKRILEYAFSHNVQQLDITCLAESKIEFPLSLFSSQTLKHLILKKAYRHKGHILRGGSMTLTSTWEVPALTTLHLNEITLSQDNTDNFSGLISKCVNLKNLTLTRCHMVGSSFIDFNIFHSQLSNLTMEYWNVRLLSVVAPQLKNLIIRRHRLSSGGIMISAPDLAYLLLQCLYGLKVYGDDFHYLEKADISISAPYREDPQNIVGLFQLLHSVKDLTLNLEILEHLSSSVEIISHQHSPLANLKSIKIYPLLVDKWQLPRDMSTEVKNYLLDGSPGATFTMVSREDYNTIISSVSTYVSYERYCIMQEIIAERNATCAKKLMAKLQVRLEQEKDDIETNRTHIEQENVPMESHDAKMDDEQNALDENQLQIEGNVKHINSCWESLGEQIKQRKKKIDDIVWELRDIKKLMTKLPASNRAEMQPCFSSLCAQAGIVMSKIRDSMKIQLDENQSRLNVCFHELTETLQSSS